jgi:hypothetical protein
MYLDSVRAEFSFSCAHALTVAAVAQVGRPSKPSTPEMFRINLYEDAPQQFFPFPNNINNTTAYLQEYIIPTEVE